MPFNFFDGLGIIGDLLGFLGNSSDSVSINEKEKSTKNSKSFVEWLSGSLFLLSAILFFLVFKDPLPPKNLPQTLIVCSIIGLVVSFVVFFVLYHLGLYYFKSLFKLLLFSGSVIIFSAAVIFLIYFKSEMFL